MIMRRWVWIAAALCLCLVSGWPAVAQDSLLTNGGLEQGTFGPYQGKGRADLNVPVGWDIWLGQGSTDQFFNRGDKVYSFPHNGPFPDPVEGNVAANLDGGYVQFNAALFQTVSTTEDTDLRAEAASHIKVCSIPEDGNGCGSDPASGGKTRIGIDPNGGTDPNASEIVWSNWLEPHDRWDRQAVEATATGGQVTLFLYFTQGGVYDINQVYWDDVSLVPGGGGGAAPGVATAGPPPTPTPQFVPFVNPQGQRDDGSIVHVVSQGDTLDSIAVAYGLTRQDIIDRNPNLGSIRFLQLGQEILIKEADPTPVAPSRSDEGIAETPIPGGVATEEAEAPDGDTTEEATIDVTVSEADSDQAEELLDAVNDLLGGGNAVPEEEGEEVAVAPTPEATEEAAEAEETEEATEEATANGEPPVIAADQLPSVDIAASTVAVCVSLFEDQNQNRLRESGENLLADGTVELSSDGVPVDTYATDGQSEPHCFTDLQAGEYVAVASAPEGYGLTTPNQLRLPLTAGSSLNIEFGAARGVETAAVPPDSAANLGNSAEEVLPAEANSLTDNILAISGIIVVALAGVVVLAGIGAAVLLRRSR